MPRDYYLPSNDEERATWLNNFTAKLPYFAIKYGITPEEVMDMQNSALYFDALIKYKNQSSAYQNAITDHKNAVRDGLSNGATLQPLMPPVMMLPPPVAPGIFKRAKALVNRIKSHVSYLETDGSDLGIIGAEMTAIDTNTIKPKFLLRLVAGGHPEIVWTRQGMGALEIQKLGSDGKWYFLAIDTVPNYIDTEPLPPSGQSAVWQYRAIYRLKDERVGMWSDVVTITVTG
jgi:hypothetical protein